MSLPVINPHAAGLDVGSEKIHASLAGAEARVFGACTDDLVALRDVPSIRLDAVDLDISRVRMTRAAGTPRRGLRSDRLEPPALGRSTGA